MKKLKGIQQCPEERGFVIGQAIKRLKEYKSYLENLSLFGHYTPNICYVIAELHICQL